MTPDNRRQAWFKVRRALHYEALDAHQPPSLIARTSPAIEVCRLVVIGIAVLVRADRLLRVQLGGRGVTVTIYHNPQSGTSRNVLTMIRISGEEPKIIEHLNTLPAREKLIDRMLEHSLLINRPIIATPHSVKLCRPSETVLDILPNPQRGEFRKKDGERVVDASGQLQESNNDKDASQ